MPWIGKGDAMGCHGMPWDAMGPVGLLDIRGNFGSVWIEFLALCKVRGSR